MIKIHIKTEHDEKAIETKNFAISYDESGLNKVGIVHAESIEDLISLILAIIGASGQRVQLNIAEMLKLLVEANNVCARSKNDTLN